MNETEKIENAARIAQFENVAQNALHRLSACDEAGPALARLFADVQKHLEDAEFPLLVDSYAIVDGVETSTFTCPTCGHDVDNDLRPSTALGYLGHAEFELATDAAPGEILGYAYGLSWVGEGVAELAYWLHTPRAGGKPHPVDLPTTWEVL